MMFTSEQIQQYIRVTIYWLAGFAVNYGWLASSQKAQVIGIAMTIANLAWTIYGNRLLAKINELAKDDRVTKILVTTKQLEKDTPSPNVVASDA